MSKPWNHTATTYNDWNMDGIANAITTFERIYDRKGNLVEEEVRVDWNADGVTDSSSLTKQTFDKKGNVLSRDYRYDPEGDGDYDTRSLHESKYTRGVETDRLERVDYQNDGVFDDSWHTRTTLNKKGDPLKVTHEHAAGDGKPVDRTDTDTYTYDGNGKLTGKSSDYLSDGKPENWMTREYTKQGYTDTYYDDLDQDGVANSSNKIAYTLDKKGNIILEDGAYDYQNDGTPDSFTRVEREFSKNGLVTSEATFGDNDGVPGWDYSYTHTYEHNKKGQVVHQETEHHLQDGTTYTDYIDYTYNKRSQLVESVFDYNGSGEGGDNRTDRFTWEYDDKGRPTYESGDYGDDGILEYWTIFEPLIA